MHTMLLSPTNSWLEADSRTSALVVPASKWLKPQVFINTSLCIDTTPRASENAGPGRWTLDAGCWMLDAAGLAVSCPLHLRSTPLETPQCPHQHVASLMEQGKEKAVNCPLLSAVAPPPSSPLCLCPHCWHVPSWRERSAV